MPDNFAPSQDYVAPIEKLRAILGGRPMPGMVQPLPQDAPVNPASLSAAQSVYGRPAPVLPVKRGVMNLQPSAPLAPPEMAAPDMNAAISTPAEAPDNGLMKWGPQTNVEKLQAQPQNPIPWQRSVIPQPPFETPARVQATETISKPAPTYADNKPKWWERLAGGLSAGAMAYGHVPGAVEAGMNVTNRRYNGAVTDYERQQRQARDVLGEQDKAYGAQSSNWRASIQDQDRDELNRIKQQNADTLAKGENDRAAARDELNDIRRSKLAPGPGKYQQNKAAVDDMRKNGVKLSQAEEKYFLVNGKLREPNPEAEARLAEAQARRLDSESNFNLNRSDKEDARVTRAQQVYNQKKADIAQREQVAFNNLENLARDKKTGTLTDPVTLESRKKELQKQFEQEYNQLGPEPQASAPSRAVAAAKPAATMTSTKGVRPAGATMKVPGSDGKLHWSDGKRDLGVIE